MAIKCQSTLIFPIALSLTVKKNRCGPLEKKPTGPRRLQCTMYTYETKKGAISNILSLSLLQCNAPFSTYIYVYIKRVPAFPHARRMSSSTSPACRNHRRDHTRQSIELSRVILTTLLHDITCEKKKKIGINFVEQKN